jgi:uncharacterized protein (DUF305 family)
MNKDALTYGVAGLFIGGLMTFFFVSNSNFGMMGSKGESRPNMMQNSQNIDAHFIEQMIPHHTDAITMAKLAQQKASREEVKQLAQNIIESQGKEIDQMKAWYKDWFGKDLPTGAQVMSQHGMMGDSSGMHMGMMGDSSDLTRLESAADFDKVFIEEMIPHHQMAVMMASMLKNGTGRAEMRQLADNIITAQTNEIDQMRVWLREWSK